MKNSEIYNLGIKFDSFFNSETIKEKYLPAKINFLIQKNKKEINKICQQLEQVRLDVIYKYGIVDEKEGIFHFKENVNIDDVNKEIDEMLNLDTDITIQKIKLSDLEGLEFTLEQMEALMFMIEED